MEEIVETLKVLVKSRGSVEVAVMLGHNNTQTLSRWIRTGKIPKGKLLSIEVLLFNGAEKKLKRRFK